MSKGVQIAGGATLIALILGWYAATNLDGGIAFTYYETLDAFMSSPVATNGEAARVHGYVAVDSIDRDVPGKRVRFVVVGEPPHAGTKTRGQPLSVVFQGLETPDLFKGGAEVVIEGHMVTAEPTPLFYADKLFAKCPSKFEAQATENASF
ncbi:MAG: cytochrome c maturation protein CcmE [Deltaproteobacteria bacterium]|nr:cytochrome c maturation protein CcmE [Deltaproteobacteria bacterium]MBW2667690.1 cytochrome c maturation protein CcmE [Deltaproteobacteria bacterium]